jgi:hypothetical protein
MIDVGDADAWTFTVVPGHNLHPRRRSGAQLASHTVDPLYAVTAFS